MITRQQRAAIVRDFAAAHGGIYDAKAFVAHVAKTGPTHPAYAWFEWDDDEAAYQYRVWQARCFGNDLEIAFRIRTVDHGEIEVVTKTGPLVHAPLDWRDSGGGYRLTDLTNPAHVVEMCAQGARALERIIERYGAVLALRGIDPDATALPLARIIDRLDIVPARVPEPA
jgi:hypothetical protein